MVHGPYFQPQANSPRARARLALGAGLRAILQQHSSSPRVVEFQAAKTDFQSVVIGRGVKLDKDQVLPIATPEDLIVLKIIATRPQDIADCIELAQIPGLDWGYIEHWCAIWGVEDRTAGVRAAADAEGQRLAELVAEYAPSD